MNEIENLATEEAKAYLQETNNGISKTRDKSWQLLAFIIAIDVYLIQGLMKEPNGCMFALMVISSIFSPIIIYRLYYSLEPHDMSFNGFEPKKMEPLFTNEVKLQKSILHSYQLAIDDNKTILTRLTGNYKKAMDLTLFFVGASVAIVVVFLFWRMFIEGSSNCS